MISLLFYASLVSFFLFVILYVKNLLASTLIAFVFYYLLNPVCEWLQTKTKLPRLLVVAIPFGILLVGLVIITTALLPEVSNQAKNLQADFPKYAEASRQLLAQVSSFLNRLFPSTITEIVFSKAQDLLADSAQKVIAAIPGIVSDSVTVAVLAPFLSFFMLMDGSDWLSSTLRLTPLHHRPLVREVMQQIHSQIGGFIRARIIETIALSLFLSIAFWIIDFPYALSLGILGGLFNLVPYVGPVISALPAFLIAFINNSEASVYIWITAIYVLSQVLDGAVLVPFLVAKIVDLHPLIVIIAVMLGAQLLGVIGMIIAIPVASSIKLIALTLHQKLIQS